jgi:hypothetical protein
MAFVRNAMFGVPNIQLSHLQLVLTRADGHNREMSISYVGLYFGMIGFSISLYILFFILNSTL